MADEARSTARLLRERAARGGLWLDVTGGSMRPTLVPPARVLVEAAEQPGAGEVWAFVTADGTVLVHRYLRRQRDGALVFRGDAVGHEDESVTPEQLVGRVRRAERGGAPGRLRRRLRPVLRSYGEAALRRARAVRSPASGTHEVRRSARFLWTGRA